MVRRGKTRKGRGGRALTPKAKPSKVIKCNGCMKTGVHKSIMDVIRCFGRGVMPNVDFLWVDNDGR